MGERTAIHGRMSLPLGRVAGVPIGLHISWVVIAALITLSLSAHFTATQPEWSRTAVWSIAVLAAEGCARGRGDVA